MLQAFPLAHSSVHGSSQGCRGENVLEKLLGCGVWGTVSTWTWSCCWRWECGAGSGCELGWDISQSRDVTSFGAGM